jgi:hypothetical protein
MKHLLLASAVLGLVATIGTANATPDTSTTVNFWNAATNLNADPNSISTDPTQQALPSAISAIQAVLGSFTLGSTSFSAPINYNLPSGGTDTSPAFLPRIPLRRESPRAVTRRAQDAR